MKKLSVVLGVCLMTVSGWGQRSNSDYKPIFNVGYNQGTHSMIQLGVEYDILSSDERWLFVGGGVLATPYHKEYQTGCDFVLRITQFWNKCGP